MSNSKIVKITCAHGTTTWRLDMDNIEWVYGVPSYCALLIKYRDGEIILAYEYGGAEIFHRHVSVSENLAEYIKKYRWIDDEVINELGGKHLTEADRRELRYIAEYGIDLTEELRKRIN